MCFGILSSWVDHSTSMTLLLYHRPTFRPCYEGEISIGESKPIRGMEDIPTRTHPRRETPLWSLRHQDRPWPTLDFCQDLVDRVPIREDRLGRCGDIDHDRCAPIFVEEGGNLF